MAPWKDESRLAKFLVDATAFLSTGPFPGTAYNPHETGSEAIESVLRQVQNLDEYLSRHCQSWHVRILARVLERCAQAGSELTLDKRFNELRSFRALLFWGPASLESYPDDVDSLLVMAYLYAVAMSLELLFPEFRLAFYGAFCIRPMREILKRIASRSASSNFGRDTPTYLSLLKFPVAVLKDFDAQWTVPGNSPTLHARSHIQGLL